MNDLPTADVQLTAITKFQAPRSDRRYSAPLIVVAAALLLFAVALSRSFYDGRLAAPMTHNDVNYFIEGLQRLALLRSKGFFVLAIDSMRGTLHAPISTYQAMLAYMVFGIRDWAPYASDFVYLLILLGFAAYLLRPCPVVVLVAAMACLTAMPLSSRTLTEFSPEIVCSLFTAIGAVLLVRLPVLDTPLRSRFLAGLCFGLGFLGHPSALPFTFIALLGTVGVAFLRDVWSWKYERLPAGTLNSLVNILLSLWLPALYLVPRYSDYASYFYYAVFDPTWRRVFYDTHLTITQNLDYYLFGPGGQWLFGYELWVYLGIVGCGIFAAWWRSDRQLLLRQIELLPLSFLFWLVPTLAPGKAPFYGPAFAFAIGFMAVIALGSTYRALRGVPGAVAVSVLGFLPLIVYQPTSLRIPNVPSTILDREFAWNAIDRLKEVLLGNATEYHGAKIYMTNMGAFAPNILQYYLLKTDPTLDWAFDSKWMDPNPRDHIDFIHDWPADYVIAGQRGNGLTYSPFAWPAENAVFEAMLKDPTYMPIDRFYGPGGHEIAIFQRRGGFAGWRAVSGIVESGRPDDPRNIPQGLAYLQTFASHPVQADLEIEWVGRAAGQKLSVLVNHQEVADLTFEVQSTPSSLKEEITLSRGVNDIVLQSDHALTVRSLLVVPHIGKDPAQGETRE